MKKKTSVGRTGASGGGDVSHHSGGKGGHIHVTSQRGKECQSHHAPEVKGPSHHLPHPPLCSSAASPFLAPRRGSVVFYDRQIFGDEVSAELVDDLAKAICGGSNFGLTAQIFIYLSVFLVSPTHRHCDCTNE
jgi:hypothetical protein